MLILLTAGLPAGAEEQAHPESKIFPINERQLPRGARLRSFGTTGDFFKIEAKPGAEIRLPISRGVITLLQPSSVALFRFNPVARRWEVVPGSRYDAAHSVITAKVPESGVYTVVGASRFEEIYDIQRALCRGLGRPGPVPPICTKILCPPEPIAAAAPELVGDVPVPISAGELGRHMADICTQCTQRDLRPFDVADCQVPEIAKPPLVPKVPLFPWPFRFCFNASNGCRPGPYLVGTADYNFENEFDLIPSGSTIPAYPAVDVRAVVRYPASTAGATQPVAGVGRFPLVIFLHGNHSVCSSGGFCSGNKACPPSDRVPNHLGYNYLLDILASWGFIAVSIDGFDVTAAWSPTMSDYEARGRLVLRHLGKWKDWDLSGTDPWGGLFHNRVDMARIGLSGHSRGGEGVVAAEYINRVEGLGFQIKAVNAIAPTDQDPYINYVPAVPYFLLLAASDGDVSNLQGLRTYDRTSLATATTQSEKEMLWVYGANHNFFNTVWSPSFGYACSSDDGAGEGRLTDSLQRLVGCQSIVPFFQLHLRNQTGYRKLFRGEVTVEGLDGVEMYWTYQDTYRKEVDNFDSGDNPNTNSLGGAVIRTPGFTTFDEYEFKAFGSDLFNSSFRHFTHGLVLGWNSTQNFRTALPAGHRDVSAYSALSFRVSQILDPLNPLDTPRTLRVALRSTGGLESNVGFEVSSLQSVPYPYEYNGGKTVLGMVRIPLTSFRKANAAFPLKDVRSILFEFRGTGLVALDDIQFTK